jgi:hypothetical protein
MVEQKTMSEIMSLTEIGLNHLHAAKLACQGQKMSIEQARIMYGLLQDCIHSIDWINADIVEVFEKHENDPDHDCSICNGTGEGLDDSVNCHECCGSGVAGERERRERNK